MLIIFLPLSFWREIHLKIEAIEELRDPSSSSSSKVLGRQGNSGMGFPSFFP